MNMHTFSLFTFFLASSFLQAMDQRSIIKKPDSRASKQVYKKQQKSEFEQDTLLLQVFSSDSKKVGELLSKIGKNNKGNGIQHLQEIETRALTGDTACQFAFWQCWKKGYINDKSNGRKAQDLLLSAVIAQYPPALFQYGVLLLLDQREGEGSQAIYAAAQGAYLTMLSGEYSQCFYLPAVEFFANYYLANGYPELVPAWKKLESDCKTGNEQCFK